MLSRRPRRRYLPMTFASFHDPSHLYFITASIIEWKHLFVEADYAMIPLNSLAWMQREKRILLFAFVVMPSHLHVILKPESNSIGEIVQQFGSFTAHEILKKLRMQKQKDLLELFNQKKRDERHEHSIWQDIQAKNIYSMKFLQQKLDYIHQNPIAKDWKLTKDRADYLYSSAGYYDYERKPIIEITDINEWLTTTPSPGTAKGA